jgi:hypothetical protein
MWFIQTCWCMYVVDLNVLLPQLASVRVDGLEVDVGLIRISLLSLR